RARHVRGRRADGDDPPLEAEAAAMGHEGPVDLFERSDPVLGEVSRYRPAALVVVGPRIDGEHALAGVAARLGHREHRSALPHTELDDERTVFQRADLPHEIAQLNLARPAVDPLNPVQACRKMAALDPSKQPRGPSSDVRRGLAERGRVRTGRRAVTPAVGVAGGPLRLFAAPPPSPPRPGGAAHYFSLLVEQLAARPEIGRIVVLTRASRGVPRRTSRPRGL